MMMLTMMFVILMMVLKIFMMLVMLMMVLIIFMMLVMLMPMMLMIMLMMLISMMLMIEMETSDSDVITAPHGREQLFPSNSARHLLLRLFVQHQNVQG